MCHFATIHDAWVVGDEPVVAIDIQMEQSND